jgi:hypothetical protein
MRAMLLIVPVLVATTVISGCGINKSEIPVWQSNKRLLQKNRDLESTISALQTENKQLKQQVETLGSLGKDVRLENLYDIQSIDIVGSTGIYTKEKGKNQQMILYFAPADKNGDAIKASGSVEVQLWNIAGKEDESLVGEWKMGPEMLKKKWGTALMNSFYRLAIDLPEKTPAKGDFVIRLSFTDYLSGKTITARKSINKVNL